MRGRVLRIDQRDVYIQVGDNVYAVHVGQTLSDAMRRRIPDADLDRLELTELFDEDWATQEKEKEKEKKPAKTSKKSR